VQAEVRLCDRLFIAHQPDASGTHFIEAMNPNSLKVVIAYLEPPLGNIRPDETRQVGRFTRG